VCPRRATRLRTAASLLLAAAFAAGCSNPWYLHRFAPNPIVASSVVEAPGTGEVRASVTFHGFRRPVPSEGQWARAELGVRLENGSDRALWLDPESLVLSSLDRQVIGESAEIEPWPGPIPRGGAADYEIVLPLREGRTPWSYDLRRMSFSWLVDFGDERIRQRVVFVQFDPVYDPAAQYPFPEDLLR